MGCCAPQGKASGGGGLGARGSRSSLPLEDTLGCKKQNLTKGGFDSLDSRCLRNKKTEAGDSDSVQQLTKATKDPIILQI